MCGVQGEDGGSMGGGGSYEFGVDPNDDPELALALRYRILTVTQGCVIAAVEAWYISSKKIRCFCSEKFTCNRFCYIELNPCQDSGYYKKNIYSKTSIT
jgi:hypothetical protein